MAIAHIQGVRMMGVSSAVPGPTRSMADLTAHYSLEEAEKIASTIGVRTRHVAAEGLCTSDLCYEAARSLLSALQWEVDTLDALVFVSQTPDYVLPATACVLHGRLKCGKHCVAFDINQGCSGYVMGLWNVMCLMKASGLRRALLLAGDTLTKIVAPQDRSSMPLFGDAGTATALEYGGPLDSDALFTLGADGAGHQHLIVPAGGFRQRPTVKTQVRTEREGGNIRSDQDLYMNGAEVFAFTLREVPAMIAALLEAAKLTAAEVDCFILHQANAFIIKHLAKKMKLPLEKVPITMGEYGNTSVASIPLSMCHLATSGSSGVGKKVVLGGFGVGFSWASALVDLDHVVFLPVQIVG